MEHETRIKGAWKNELGSVLTISTATENRIEGHYSTAVARADEMPKPARMIGSYQICEDGGILITFAVQWKVRRDGKDASSSCCWNGKLHPGDDGFDATYLLVSDLPREDMWRSVLTNKNSFRRIE